MNEAPIVLYIIFQISEHIFQYAPIKFDILYEAALSSWWCVFMNMYSFYGVN